MRATRQTLICGHLRYLRIKTTLQAGVDYRLTGDYPLLDWARSTGLPYLVLVSALCWVVMLFTMLPTPIHSERLLGGSEVRSSESKGKLCCSQLAEGIPVFQNAPYLEFVSSGLNVRYFIGRQSTSEQPCGGQNSSWKDRVVGFKSIRLRKINIVHRIGRSDVHRKGVTDFSSYRLPMIFKQDSNTNQIALGRIPIEREAWSNRDICSEPSLARDPCVFNQAVGCLSERNGKKAQDDRKKCDYNRSNGNYFIVPLMDKPPNFAGADFDNEVRGGAVFFFGLILFGAFACCFWLILTGRKPKRDDPK